MMRQACRQVGMVGSWSRTSQLFSTGHSLFLGKGGSRAARGRVAVETEDPCDYHTPNDLRLATRLQLPQPLSTRLKHRKNILAVFLVT